MRRDRYIYMYTAVLTTMALETTMTIKRVPVAGHVRIWFVLQLDKAAMSRTASKYDDSSTLISISTYKHGPYLGSEIVEQTRKTTRSVLSQKINCPL